MKKYNLYLASGSIDLPVLIMVDPDNHGGAAYSKYSQMNLTTLNDYDHANFDWIQEYLASKQLKVEKSAEPKTDTGTPSENGWGMVFYGDEMIAALYQMFNGNIFNHPKNKQSDLEDLQKEFERMLAQASNDPSNFIIKGIIKKYTDDKIKLHEAKENANNVKSAEYTDTYNDAVSLLEEYEKKPGRDENQKAICTELKAEIKSTIPETKDENHLELLFGAMVVAEAKAKENHKKNGTFSFLGTTSSLAGTLNNFLKTHGVNEKDKNELAKRYNEKFPRQADEYKINLKF